MKGKILITFFVALFLLSIIPYETIQATSITYSIGFEGCVADSPVTYAQTTYLMTKKKGGAYFNASASVPKSGTRSLGIYKVGTTTAQGWINLSYSKTSFLTSFNFNIRDTKSASGTTFFMIFYNKTTQWSKLSSALSPNTTNGIFTFFISTGVTKHNVGCGTAYYSAIMNSGVYYKFAVNITDNIGNCNLWKNNSSPISFTSSNSTAINNGCRIDSIYCYMNTYSDVVYMDDINITISDSYVSGSLPGGCIDVSDMDYYSKNIEIMDGYIDISSPFIEFTSHSSLSLTPEVFELWVGSALYEGDSDTSNYFLYINGISCGNPECFYLLSGQTYVIQWDLSSISPISEEVLTFELAHSITFDGTNYWNIARATANLMYGAPSPTIITYKNTGTNGVLDGTPIYYGSCWKLYFSAFGTPENEENTDFDVGINLIGFNTHPIYNTPYSYIYETIYFEVFSNRTDSYYHLNVSKGATTQGNEQGYPKDIYSYHIIHGFTPTTNGNYTVSLCKDSDNTIVDHKHFNITIKTVDYAIWTFPNPSNTGVNHGVTVYISDDTVFQNYYVSGVVDEDNVNIFNLSNRKILVGTLDGNKYWSTSLITFAVSGWEYWRLWGTNDNVSFIPLTSPYVHYVNSIAQYNYIRTSLTDGEGYTGESFNVYGQHSYILSQLSVYLDNKPIKDVSTNVSFLIPYSFSSVGTHTFSLRVFNDGVWETVDSVVVSITIKPSGGGELGEFLPAPYSYIMGAILTIVLMILPTIAIGKVGLAQGETLKYVPIFSGTVGFILSCLIGFFPWYSIFALLFVLILIITVLYLSKKKE